jgi:hypothetical protein
MFAVDASVIVVASLGPIGLLAGLAVSTGVGELVSRGQSWDFFHVNVPGIAVAVLCRVDVGAKAAAAAKTLTHSG